MLLMCTLHPHNWRRYCWLERAKKAYHQKGQGVEWQAYIDNLRTNYARRPALQKEIQGL